jgi:two-component system CheB/CheR fusion protein
MLGHSGDEVLGKPVASFHADPAGIEQLERRLASGETIHDHEAELLRRDGSRRRVLIDANGSWESGEFAYARWFMRDVTERRVAEELLRHSEARFRSLVSILSDVTWVADEHGGFASRQLEWEAYTGQRWPEHQGFGFANAFHPDDRERLISAWRDVCSSGASFEAPGRIWHAPSKTWRHFVARATQLDPAGRPREWVGTCVDVDESVRAAEALREADRRKDEFLAILAHELRNPLAPIRNSLHILRLSSQGDPATTRVGEMVERQVNHMVRLIDDLMEVSRITRGKIELRKETLEIGGIVRAAIESSRPLIDARRLQLAVELPPEPLTLDGDAVRLTQVVTNLLNNATKFTEPSGRIRVAVRRESDRVAISVSDTGAGIPREMLTRVFDLFTQGGADRSQGGLGIGLALVKTLVELHGGSVTARSDGPGAGSEFLVRLPLDTAGRRDEPSAEHAPRRPTRRSRVLVVDDNRDGAESLGRLLELLGAEVRTEYGGQAALDMIGSYRPALVLLDIGMPELDGYEVARRIRERPELRDVTLVALTGWGQEADRLRSRRAGFDRHLVKPAAIGDLEALLASLEDGSRPVSAAATGVATSGPAARV